MANPLSADSIANLLKIQEAQKKQARASKSGGGRKVKDTTEPRDRDTWFRQNHAIGVCGNPDCADPRPTKVEHGVAMVAAIHDVTICRYCFLAGYLSPNAKP